MDRNNVAVPQQLLHVLIVLAASRLHLGPIFGVAESGSLHSHRLADVRYQFPDGPYTDNTHLFPLQFKGFIGIPDLPVSFPQFRVGLLEVFRQGKHTGHRVLCHRAVVGARGEDHRNPQAGGMGHVHIIIAHASAANHVQIGTPIDQIRRTPPNADDKTIGIFQMVQIVLRLCGIGHIHLCAAGVQYVHTRLAKGMGQHDFQLSSAFLSIYFLLQLRHSWSNSQNS